MDTQIASLEHAVLNRGPRVSVVTPAYNASAYLVQAIDSILSQTFADFELIVVDDASTDQTAAILASYQDPRLRVVRNETNQGIVRTRNRGMAMARGEFICPFDADDVSLPTKLAKQVTFMDSHPTMVMVGTATRYLEFGEIKRGKSVRNTEPSMMRWLMHVENPLGHSTLMYRASAVLALGSLMDEDFKYAEDYEFCHRLLGQGDAGFLDEPLVLYRRHPGAVSVIHEEAMLEYARRVTARVYRPWFGDETEAAALMINQLLFARRPPGSTTELNQLGDVLSRLAHGFLATYALDAEGRAAILAHAGSLWWGVVRSGVRSGQITTLLSAPPEIARNSRQNFPAAEAARSTVSGLVPFKGALRRTLRRQQARGQRSPAKPVRLQGVSFQQAPVSTERPPTLYVVVDTEAEFDWDAPFDREQTSVTAMAAIERGQAVFDQYGLRPVYVTDYAVASQPGGVQPLLAIYNRGACEIGAHLHPWITPPFEEALSVRNSFAGNLPAQLEERKLVTLLAAFHSSFGFSPKFFKSGRYGLGPNTVRLLSEHGIAVDFSIIPGRDLTPKGGPDFRPFTSDAMTTLDGRLLAVPMTRGPVGLLSRHSARLAWHLESGRARQLSLPGVFSHLGLLETVTLTPEGVPADKQVALIRAMLARKERSFVLHYHSPSLAAGFTPYARDDAGVDEIVNRLSTVCRVFFEELGGVPGQPQDLLPRPQRSVNPLVKAAVARWETVPLVSA